MSRLVSSLPLRLPLETDIGPQLARWLDHHNQNQDNHHHHLHHVAHLTAASCREDLDRVGALRSCITTALSQGVEAAYASRAALQEYAAVLQACEERGFPSSTTTTSDSYKEQSILQFPWKSSAQLEEVYSTLSWERANVLWNLAVLSAYEATLSQPDVPSSSNGGSNSRVAWKQAGAALQTAASILRYLQTDVLPAATESSFPSGDLSISFLTSWEAFCMADAQHAFYQAVASAPRPMHTLLAKISAAAVPLYSTAEDLCGDSELENNALSSNWADAVRAWGMWMSALCEYHQAQVHVDKQEWGVALARLEGAQKFGSLCLDFCSVAEDGLLDSLSARVYVTLQEMEDKLEEADVAHAGKPVPDREELPEIPPQTMVELETDIHKFLPPLQRPLFASAMSSPSLRYLENFRSDMARLVEQTTADAEEKTDSGRRALATVNLPHSLTAYRQEQQGGGIPEELWERVEGIQKNETMKLLKQELWALCDVADRARTMYKTVENTLDEDLQVDSLFRTQHATFEGHDLTQVQRSFRATMQNYPDVIRARR
jgi:BRO1-like domain